MSIYNYLEVMYHLKYKYLCIYIYTLSNNKVNRIIHTINWKLSLKVLTYPKIDEIKRNEW